MKNRIMQLRTLIAQLRPRHLNVAACVAFNRTRPIHSNWGDELNYYFLPRLFRRTVCISDYSWLCRFRLQRQHLIIGSTIGLKCTRNTVIWGAGVLSGDSPLPEAPAEVLAVRGPRTRSYLLSKGVDCPAVYGDPALLLPMVYRPANILRKHTLGIIPHYQDMNSDVLRRYEMFHPDCTIINLRHYKRWTDVIDAICSCEAIISSSLHGLIAAAAYGIPHVWAVISPGSTIGGEFKFRDFFESVGQAHVDCHPLQRAESELSDWTPLNWDAAPLLQSAPYPISPCPVN